MIEAVESAIIRATTDIKKKQGNVGSDKIISLSKLINSYSLLVERAKDKSEEMRYYHLGEDLKSTVEVLSEIKKHEGKARKQKEVNRKTANLL